MRYIRYSLSCRTLAGAVGALALVLSAAQAVAAAEGYTPDPVEELKQALKNAPFEKDQLDARQDELKKRIEALRTVSDMRQALALEDWQDGKLPTTKGKIKSISVEDPDNKKLVLTDQDGKESTFLLKDDEDGLRKDKKDKDGKVLIKDMDVKFKDLKKDQEVLKKVVGQEVTVSYEQENDKAEKEAVAVWDRDIEDVDRLIRAQLAKRFAETLRGLLEGGDTAGPLAALTLIGEMGVQVRGVGTHTAFARSLAPDIVALLKRGEGRVREVGARTLGMVDPDPEVALPALKRLLSAPDRAQRRAAAEALVQMMRVVTQLSTSQSKGQVTATMSKSTKLPVEVVVVGKRVVPVAGQELVHDDPEVRRLCVEAIQAAGAALVEVLLQPPGVATRKDTVAAGGGALVDSIPYLRKLNEDERAQLQPLADALNKVAPLIGKALKDTDVGVRLQAGQALQEIGSGLQRLGSGATGAPRGHATEAALSRPARLAAAGATVLQVVAEQPADRKATVALSPERQKTLSELESRLLEPDSDVRVRRAVVDAIETYAEDAVGAIEGLTKALDDPDRFVRWAAARTLGRIDPKKVPVDERKPAVKGLEWLLTDADLDVRVAAAKTLEAYGPLSAAAVDALSAAVAQGDAEGREAAIHALEAIGLKAMGESVQTAIKALSSEKVLGNDDARVRRAAAETLGRFAAAARSAQPALQKALDDDDADVRRAAADALANILLSPKGR